MDAFREPTPEEAKMIALQFIGQNIGSLKELDKNIISRNPTLQGNTLNVQGVLNSIPAPNRPVQPQQPQRIAAPLASSVPVNNSANLIDNSSTATNLLNKIATLLETVIKLLEKR
jgi:hypothetical protein